jgi:hypothetical protein
MHAFLDFKKLLVMLSFVCSTGQLPEAGGRDELMEQAGPSHRQPGGFSKRRPGKQVGKAVASKVRSAPVAYAIPAAPAGKYLCENITSPILNAGSPPPL